jgi:hypothetical protein
METVVESAGSTRQTRRERTKTPKALELEKRKHRGNSSKDWDESNKSDTDDVIEVRDETPDAPRPNRTRHRPKTLSHATTRGYTMTEEIEGDLLSTILSAIKELKRSNEEVKASNVELIAELVEVKAQLAEAKAQLAEIAVTTRGSPQQSYASVLARATDLSFPASQPAAANASRAADKLYCTIDTSKVEEEDKSKAQLGAIRKAIEEEIRTIEGQEHWRCVAVIKDARNYDRIRVTCRDEAELQRVKKAAEKTAVTGVRVLRDQLYPVKVDNANRTAILDQDGKVLPGAAEVLGKENDVHIAKIGWLSRKDTGKAYGSMVVYVTKGSEAARLLQDQYFHVAGESAYAGIFERRYGPQLCYRCQELGHKAYSCTKPQVCAKCAQVGHHHSECQVVIPKCVLCGGPHESFSRNCGVLHNSQDA